MENFTFTYINTSNVSQHWYVGEGNYFELQPGKDNSYQAQYGQGDLTITVKVGGDSVATTLTFDGSSWSWDDPHPSFAKEQKDDEPGAFLTVSCWYAGESTTGYDHKHHHHDE